MYKDIKTEQAVLACMLINENCSYDYGLLSVEDFTDEINKLVFTGIKNLVKQNKNVDFITVYNQLNQKVPVSYLAELSGALPTTANFRMYVDQLKDLTLKRKLLRLADEIRNTEKPGKELAEYAEKEIFELRQETSINQFTKIDNIIFDVLENIEDIYKGKKERGISTGFHSLDYIVGGLRKKEYIILAARPSMGKTALAINIAENLIMTNKIVAFFSFEMSKEQLVERLIRGASFVDKRKLNKENGMEMDDNEWDKLVKASNRLSIRNLFIDDDPYRTIPEMLSMCMKLKREKGLDLVIIDYLQKIRCTEKGTKREQLEYVSNDIKNMAKLLDVPVIAISSLSRANENREIKIPQLSDLRETGQLEFDADVIIFLHREYYYKRTDESLKYDADVVVAKNRNGSIGRTKLMWFADITKFLTKERGEKYIEKINSGRYV